MTPVLAAAPPAASPALTAWLSRIPFACTVVALMALLVPVALTWMPPLLDYPNHVARMWLLAGGAEQAPLSGIYAVDWSGATTNIGADLVAATLGRLVGIWTLAPVLLGAAVLLPPLGAVLLNRAVFGGWHWWQAGFAVLAWNGTLVAGFLNFQIGLGLALLAAALDPAGLRRLGPWGVVPVRMVLAAVLMVAHPFAAGFYGVLLAGLAFGAEKLGKAFWHRAARATGAGIGVAVPVICFLLLSPTVPGGSAPTGIFDPWGGYSLANKALTLLSAILTYDPWLDLFFVLMLWVLARLVATSSMLQSHAGLMLSALGLAALALVVPSELGSTVNADWRFPIMAVLSVAAALRPGLRSVKAAQAAGTALLLLAVARTGWIGSIWQERQADVSALEEALAFVPAGAAVLPVMHAEAGPAPRGRMLAVGVAYSWHLHSLAVPLRHAFVPTLFAAPGKQPLRVLPPWSEIAVPEGQAALVHHLREPPLSTRGVYGLGYVAHWRERFQYALVLNAQATSDDEASIPELRLVADRGFARLYQITGRPEEVQPSAGLHTEP